MARLLIAGYGFLGEALDQVFSEAGWEVVKLSRSGRGTCVKCDISSCGEVEQLAGEYDLIIHCAASGGGGVESYRNVYLEGCRNLLKRFPTTPLIFTSSTSVYAQTDHSVVTEISPAEPVAATAGVLRQAEKLTLSAGGVVTRLSGLYGPGRCHVLKNLISGTARIDGAGERIMNFIHRDDVARAMLLLGSLSPPPAGEIYNVSSEPVRQYDCYAALAEAFSCPMPGSMDAGVPRKRGNTSKRVSHEKLRGLGWQPRYTEFVDMANACEVV
ncbi:MAG: NAD-dependent epimerase/dehydratase family protein [Verrucomicrobiae bacterium]|nr:NAD-dependent epimerase/dehydratase family protein [Verrucomicrobiae bacterium]NNJ42275.1 NAD-dependent epimerase/dehydratase family protein [Akkermansiaceae bacterium]